MSMTVPRAPRERRKLRATKPKKEFPKAKSAKSKNPPKFQQGKFTYDGKTPIESLRVAKVNPRKHPAKQIKEIAIAIKRFGFTQPIIIDPKGNVIAGHGRLGAARELGLKTVSTIKVTGWSQEQKRTYLLFDNEIAAKSGWRLADLQVMMQDLIDSGVSLDGIGFEAKDMEVRGSGELPPRKTAKSKVGQIYQLGRHRLLVDDATNKQQVDKLMDGAKPTLMVTDPPYGVDYDPSWRIRMSSRIDARFKIENDDRADWDDALRQFTGETAYVWTGMGGLAAVGALEAGLKLRAEIVWVKHHFRISRSCYHWQHESCWYLTRSDKTKIKRRNEENTWFIDAPPVHLHGHPTQKPIECMERPIINSSAPGDVVYDPFAGTGTTLIAAEKQNRIAYVVELDPVHADVIIKRWKDECGGDTVLVS